MADDESPFGFFGDDDGATTAPAVDEAPAVRELEAGDEVVLRDDAAAECGDGMRLVAGRVRGEDATIKVITGAGAVARARAERDMLVELRHVNVLRLTAVRGLVTADDVGADAVGEALLVFEPVNGRPLGQLIFSTQPIEFELQSKLLLDVARGLSYLHGNGVVLGRLRAASIALTADRSAAVVADIPAPREGDHRAKVVGAIGVINDPYLSPELCIAPSEGPTQDGDVYAFGVLAWEVFARQPISAATPTRPAPVAPELVEEEAPPTEGAGAEDGAGGDAGGVSEEAAEEVAVVYDDADDWQPRLPRDLDTLNARTLLGGCLRVRTVARLSAAMAVTCTERIHTQARQARVASENPSRWVADLPVELALEVFRFLMPRDVAAVRATCLAWRLLTDAFTEPIWGGAYENMYGGPVKRGRGQYEHLKEVHTAYVGLSTRKAELVNDFAIQGGHYSMVARRIQSGLLDPNKQGRKNQSPLHHAVNQGNVRLAKVLLAGGARVDEPVPLMLASARKGSVEVMLAVLDALQNAATGGSVADLSQLPLSAMLLQAAGLGAAPMVEWLLRAGARPDPPDVRGNSPLVAAILNGDMTTVELLLGAGASLAPITGSTPLTAAVERNNLRIVTRLLEAGAQVVVPLHATGRPERCLHVAASWPWRMAVLEALIARDEPERIATSVVGALTPLHVAAASCNVPAVVRLLQLSRTPLVASARVPYTPLVAMFARIPGAAPLSFDPERLLPMVRLLVAEMGDAAVLADRFDGRTVLELILRSPLQEPELLEALVTEFPVFRELISVPNAEGVPLLTAHLAHRPRLATVELLLANGARIAPDAQGWTPIYHVFIASNRLSADQRGVLDALITAGDSMTARDPNGVTPLMALVNLSHIDAYVERGADVHAVDAAGQGVLWWWIGNCFASCAPEIVAAQRRYALDARLRTATGDTLLHRLVQHGGRRFGFARDQAVAWLVSLGIDVHAVNAAGQTALQWLRAADIDQRLLVTLVAAEQGTLPPYVAPAEDA